MEYYYGFFRLFKMKGKTREEFCPTPPENLTFGLKSESATGYKTCNGRRQFSPAA